MASPSSAPKIEDYTFERKSSELKRETSTSDREELPVPVLTFDAQTSTKKIFGTPNHETVRGMHSRHLTFIAIGGTLGTGIFLSAGSSVATSGAGGALLAYCVVGFFVYGVVLTLGEMSSLIPVSGAFATFGDRFVSPVLGGTLGVNYVIQWCVSSRLVGKHVMVERANRASVFFRAFSIPSELTAASIILSYWTEALQTWEWYASSPSTPSLVFPNLRYLYQSGQS